MRTNRRRVAWLGSLCLVLLMLGHDGLMATVAHAAPAAPPAIASHPHAPPHDTVVVADDTHEPAHPTTCGVAGNAVPGPGIQLDPAECLLSLALVTFKRTLRAQPFAPAWPEPHWPPGTRRALLQVYRI